MPSFPAPDDLDPRLTPARGDLAASWLQDKIKADKFVEPRRELVLSPVATLYRSPDQDQAIETQLIYGEPVDVLENKKGWAWVQSARDGYVGYLRSENLIAPKGDTSPTHRVMNVGTFVYGGPNMKSTPKHSLSFGSLLRVVSMKDDFAELSTGGFVPTQHISPIDFHAEDPVAEAFRFLGVPYLWGGRSHLGIDCAGLVQLVLQACNIKSPRDSDLQEKSLGKPIDREQVRSGDLVFFRDHVGLMVDETTMIHANDRAMAVSIDDLDEYVHWRTANGKMPIKLFKRIV
jgi:cell wall-associated NlpC family hydrolase